MFCKYCGKNMSDTANFCVGCGNAIYKDSGYYNVSSTSQPELDFSAIKKSVEITLQGVTPDLKRANGSFDEVRLGSKPINEFGNLLKGLSYLDSYIPDAQTSEICPVSLVVHNDGNLYAFELLRGSVLYSNENRVVSPQEAMAIIAGQNVFSPATKKTKDKNGNIHNSSSVWGSDHKDIRGLYPVRRPEIPPTDPVNTSAYTIKIQQSYTLTDRVIRSIYATGMYKAPLIFSLVPFVLSIGGFLGGMLGFGLLMILGTFLMFAISGIIWANSKDDITFGFDWTQNVVFAKFSREKKPSYLNNANCIIDFFVDYAVVKMDRLQNIGGTSHIYTRVTDKHEYWYITARKTDGTTQPLIALFTQDDANRVCTTLNNLLLRQ